MHVYLCVCLWLQCLNANDCDSSTEYSQLTSNASCCRWAIPYLLCSPDTLQYTSPTSLQLCGTAVAKCDRLKILNAPRWHFTQFHHVCVLTAFLRDMEENPEKKTREVTMRQICWSQEFIEEEFNLHLQHTVYTHTKPCSCAPIESSFCSSAK